MEQDYKYMVRVSCMTFNHASYIVDAMNGFTMQETTFPFVCTIVDDASTDGEPEVIKQYLSEHFDLNNKDFVRNEETDDFVRIFSRHKENVNCYFLVILLKYNHYSIKKAKSPYFRDWVQSAKYIATCEGDDYWIDPHKLQKQVDFMEDNPDFSLCFHNALVEWMNPSKENKLFAELETREYFPKEIITKWIAPTASLLYTKKSVDIYQKLTNNKIVYGDSFLRACCIHCGKVYCLAETMSVYRKHSGGLVFGRSAQQMKRYANQLYYMGNVFPEQRKYFSGALSHTYFDMALIDASKKEYVGAIRSLLHSLYSSPKMFFYISVCYIKLKCQS